MKKVLQIFILSVFTILYSQFTNAQFPYGNVNYPAASYTIYGSQGAVSFVIGNKSYTGTGSFLQEFWEYDPATNTWTQKADFPGEGRLRAVAFSIGNKGYVGTGQSSSSSTSNDFWEYDPATNVWTQKANIPVGRRAAVGFSIGNKGYVGLGAIPSSSISTDFYEYNPATDSWTSVANLPATARRGAAGFSIGSKGYIGTGLTTSNVLLNDFWEFNPSSSNSSVVASSGTIAVPIPDNSLNGNNHTLNISTVPAGAAITGIRVQLTMPHTWVGDAVIVLKAPNGNIINLDYLLSSTFGTGPTTGMTNTIISSAGTTSLSAGVNPYSGTFKPDGILTGNPQPGPNGYLPNVNDFSSLYSIPNGNWTLAIYDAYSGDVGTLTSWSVTIDYTLNGSWTQKADFGGIARIYAVGISTNTKGYIGTGSNISTALGDVFEYDPGTNSWITKGIVGARIEATGFAIGSQIYFGLGVNGSTFIPTFVRLSPYWEVRNSTGDYEEGVLSGSPTCFLYPMQYSGSWSAYTEYIIETSGFYAGYEINSNQDLGNLCYKSRVDAGLAYRGGYGWYGGTTKEEVRFCRRNLRIEFENQPTSPVGFRIYYTKQEIDNLISNYNSTFGTNKTYNDLLIIKYSGVNQDLDPTNNSNNNSDYQQIAPSLTFYGNNNQFVYAEFNVSSYSEFYLGLTKANGLFVNDASLTDDIYTSAIGNNSNPGTPSAPFATLDFAVSVAQPGDTIYVDAGTYVTPNFTIGKALTILGPNYTIEASDVNDRLLYNTLRNPEAIISNSAITIGSSNIRIEGLTFDPLSKSQFLQTNTSLDYSNILLSRNRFFISSNLSVINLTGRNITPLSSNSYLIINNRFEKTGGTSGITVLLNFINDAQLNGNVFTVANAGLARIQSAINIGSSGKVDNLTIAGNIFDRYNATINTTRIGATLVDNNNCYDNQTGFQMSNNITEPASVSVTRNYFSNFRVNGPVQFNRSVGSDASGVNRMLFEDNIVNADVTGQTFSALVVPVCQSTVANAEIKIRKNIITYSGDFSLFTYAPLAVRPAGKFAVITVDSNEISFNGINFPASSGGTIPLSGIFIFSNPGSAANAIPANAVININNNKVSGYKQSVGFYNAQLSQYGGLASGITANINNNSFFADSISINNGTISETVNANCNWYGSAAAQDVLSKVTPATVNYSPWLINGTDNDNDPATGFQPVPGSCNGTAVTVVLTQATNINCFGQNTGAIDITALGGTAPYNFTWTKSGDPGYNAATEDISGLTAGIYHLIVTDANSSVATLDVSLTEPATALSISLTGTDITCFGNNNGSIAADVNGGTTPYTYLWSNGGTASSISGLAAGGYTVVVNDANGCNVSTGYNVLEPALLAVTINGTTASCNGTATATATGGTIPYSYLWSNGATTSSINNVPAGLYTLAVTDANGCTANGSYTITGNSNINPSTAIVHVSCFGTATGSITVTGAGGVAPHTYNINGSAFQANNVFSNLLAGVYVIGVKDANGCSDFVTKTITEPTLLTVVLDDITRPCGGFGNGKIFITASGGSGGKTYNWTGPNGYSSTAQDPSNLFAGTYSLTVTDNKGCTANLVVELNEWPAISITEVVTNVACNGDFNGAIDVTLTGGTGMFTYSWTGPNGFTSASEDISGLKSGNYKTTVTDVQSGCTLQKTIVVTQSANLNISTSKTNVTGCNSLGTITANGSGGTPVYQYSLDGFNYQQSGSFAGLYGGNFTVWVKDNNGCTKSKAITITDNGTDEYEGNNNKNQAKTINIGEIVNARIAITGDAADWFKFTTPLGNSNYVLTLNHSSVNFTFLMYPAGNNTPALISVNSTANSKEYILSENTTYYISITGGFSYSCYQLSVAPLLLTRPSAELITEFKLQPIPNVNKLSAKAFPNPHQGNFSLSIESPETGNAKIELWSAEGKLVTSKNAMLLKDRTSKVDFANIRQRVLFYRIILGKHIVQGKIIGPE